MTQEHGRVEPISGVLDYSKFPLGTLLTLIPYHVSSVWCSASSCLNLCHTNVSLFLSCLSLCWFLQSCATAMMHRVYHVHSQGRLVGKWTPTHGWWTAVQLFSNLRALLGEAHVTCSLFYRKSVTMVKEYLLHLFFSSVLLSLVERHHSELSIHLIDFFYDSYSKYFLSLFCGKIYKSSADF